MSYKLEVKTVGDKTWSSNALRFATIEEANIYGKDLFHRWTAVTEYQATLCDDPVNYTLDVNGKAIPIWKAEVTQ